MPESMLRRTLPEPGEVLGGKYRVVRRLGEGGMGVVYEAVHTRIHQRVAIKMLLPEVIDLPDVVSRFEREARAAGKLRSENTARVLDVDVSDGGMPYMVMEFLDGVDLGKMLEDGGALPIATAVDFVLQACNAMAEAHSEGVIHRDLKPSNLFVTGGKKLKVLDFGISKLENDQEARVTATQAVVGTPLYMSPEQVRSAKHVDTRSDIWSLGIILYELLTGRTPFEGSTTAAAAAICIDPPPPIGNFRQGIPAELERAILNALQKEPANRFSSVQAFAQSIASFGSGSIQTPDTLPAPIHPVRSHPSLPEIGSARTLPHSDPAIVPMRVAGSATSPGWTTRSAHAKNRSPVIIGIIAAVAMVTLIGLIGLLAFLRRGDATQTPRLAAPARDTATAQPTATTPQPPTPSTSVSTSGAVPSPTVASTQPTHPVSTQTRPHATPNTTATATPAPTHTTAPAPTPTRL